ncbi:MAG: sodium ion-translocating decarboxylase subunit beta [Oscillospiraceae bacterium]|nr:sodium ion-translocating decarboxylase subunit beta [Oscillospiraceae bacterium]
MENQIKKYLHAVRRRLNLPKDIKNRCISDLQTTIQARTENGESWEEIQSSLGSPKEVAAELSEQMREYVYHKSPWRFLFLAAAVLSGGWLVFYAGMQMVLSIIASNAASIGVIGGADGPTAIFVTTGPVMNWDALTMGAVCAACIAAFLLLRKCKPKQ